MVECLKRAAPAEIVRQVLGKEEKAVMIPLMDQDTYKKFDRIRLDLERSSPNISNVFVPVGCEKTPQQKFRILFVGRATQSYRCSDVSSYNGSVERNSDIVKNFNSPFWSFSRKIIRGLGGTLHINEAKEEPEKYFGWSNLCKIGDTKGNPTLDSIRLQAPLCVESLRSEIYRFAPTAVVFCSTKYNYRRIGQPSFGEADILQPLVGDISAENGWEFDPENVDITRFKINHNLGTNLIYTNHPQAMGPAGSLKIAIGYIVKLVTRWADR